MAEDQSFDWSDPLPVDDNDSAAFTLLEPGVYWGQVQRYESLWHDGRNCPMAKVVTIFKDEEGSAALVFENILLHGKTLWKLRQFFIGLGQGEHGKEITPKWSEVAGAPVRARLKQEEYNGKTKNVVDAFIDWDTSLDPPEWTTKPVKPFGKNKDEEEAAEPEGDDDIAW